jgi:hypothetical protein
MAARGYHRGEGEAGDMQRRDGAGVIIVGVILILIGGYFLLRQALPELRIDRLWPIGVIAVGLLLLVGSLRGSRA